MGQWKATVKSRNLRAALNAARKLCQGDALLPRVVTETDQMMMAVQARAAELAPVAEGTLRGSATSWAHQAGNAIQGGVEFGGMATAYAEAQHEHTQWHHTLPAGMSRTHRKSGKPRTHAIKGYRGGQAHFLYGQAPRGAWEELERKLMRRLDQRIGMVAEEILRIGTS